MGELAGILAGSAYSQYEWSGCAGSAWDRLPDAARARHIHEAQRWLDAATAAGLAVVQLPEPALGPDLDGHMEFSDGSAAGTVRTDLGSGVVWHGTWEWTVDEARDVAAQWLAAARSAERKEWLNTEFGSRQAPPLA